jgi:hypothetical protein
MLLDEEVEHMHPEELIWAPKYPKHFPCVVSVKWQDPDSGSVAYEHTFLNLGAKDQPQDKNAANRPKNPGFVHKQLLAVDKSVYLVEQLFGGEHEDDGDEGTGDRAGSELVLGEIMDEGEGGSPGGESSSPAAGNVAAVVDSDDDEGLCVICLCEPKDTCCIPCRHLCLCQGCANELQKHSPRCPVCRQPFGQLLHLGA